MTGTDEKIPAREMHKEPDRHICFLMEKESRTVYYVTTGKETISERKSLPVYHCDRTLPYPGGEIHIFSSTLPDGLEEEFKKKRKKKKREQQLLEAMERALELTDENVEILFSDNLCRIFNREQSVSDELYAAWLFQKLKGRTAPHFSLELPGEYGFLMREKVLFLLQPYLKRINRITFIKRRSVAEEAIIPGMGTGIMDELADYFYGEYGILSGQAEEPEVGSFYLKLSNDAQMLNFLDTTVKSGYNTKVD